MNPDLQISCTFFLFWFGIEFQSIIGLHTYSILAFYSSVSCNTCTFISKLADSEEAEPTIVVNDRNYSVTRLLKRLCFELC